MRLSEPIKWWCVAGLFVAMMFCPQVRGDNKAADLKPAVGEEVVLDGEHQAAASKLIDDGVKFLLDQRGEDGGWSIFGQDKPAMTAMVLKALVRHDDFGLKHPAVRKGFDLLLSYRRVDGGIYDPGKGRANYTTAVAVMAMVAAKDPAFKQPIDGAIRYLRGLQIVPGAKSPDGDLIGENDPRIGGVSYGAKHVRPDLSNLGFWMDACREAGISGDDPHMKRAMLFVSRCQNRSESNPQPWARLGADDGGFVYAPSIRGKLNVGESKAGVQGRGLRSYGSMTYTGFKSLLYADVDRKDPRVQAAFLWIRKHWRLDSNPNMPAINSQEGLYYYYYVFAKALRAWGRPVIADLQGERHNWRHELIDALSLRVKPDGSWQGDKRWYEKFPVLATSYSVLALQEALVR